MANDDKFILILEKLSDIGERTARIEVEQKNANTRLEKIESHDEVQNQLLAEHIRGVETANSRLDNEIEIRRTLETEQALLKSRVTVLEEPKKFLIQVKQIALYIAAISGAVLAIMKWFSL